MEALRVQYVLILCDSHIRHLVVHTYSISVSSTGPPRFLNTVKSSGYTQTTTLVLWQHSRNMYCPVYGCNSDSQKTTSPPTHFFSFPSGKSADQQYRRKVWIEFCKRKAFQPSSCTRICSLHFAEDAYEPGNSPQFLERLQFKENVLVRLKKDALPTLNKALENPSTTTSGKTRDSTVRRQRIKV